MKQKAPGYWKRKKFESFVSADVRLLKSFMGGIFLFFLCGYTGLFFSFQGGFEEADILEVNQIYQEVLMDWENLEKLDGFRAGYDFRVID